MALFGKKTKNTEEKQAPVAVAESPVKQTSLQKENISIPRPMLVKLHISEKAYAAQSHRGYVFVVRDNATKPMIRKEVEKRYNVNVSKISMVRHKGKTLRLRGGLGRRPHIKKAIVTLREGQAIEIT